MPLFTMSFLKTVLITNFTSRLGALLEEEVLNQEFTEVSTKIISGNKPVVFLAWLEHCEGIDSNPHVSYMA